MSDVREVKTCYLCGVTFLEWEEWRDMGYIPVCKLCAKNNDLEVIG